MPMSLKIPGIPPFLIEVKAKSSTNPVHPWTVFQVGLSDHQAQNKVKEYSGNYPDFEFRATPNNWREISDLDSAESELSKLTAFRKSIVDKCGTDDVSELARLISEGAESAKKLKEASATIDRLSVHIDFLQDPAGELKQAFDYAFEVGDKLRDIHSKTEITVTAIGNAASKGSGFDWEGPGGETGHCPIESIECFEPTKKVKSKAGKTKPPFQGTSAIDAPGAPAESEPPALSTNP